MLLYKGEETKLQAGDVIEFDPDNETITFTRDSTALTRKEDGDDAYWICPTDGVQYRCLAEMIGDVAGFRVQEMKGEGIPMYRLV